MHRKISLFTNILYKFPNFTFFHVTDTFYPGYFADFDILLKSQAPDRYIFPTFTDFDIP